MPQTTKTLDIELPPEYFPLTKTILGSIDESKADSIRIVVEGPPDMLADDPIASISGDETETAETSPNSSNGQAETNGSDSETSESDINVEVHGGDSTDDPKDPPDGQLLKHVQREQADVSDASASARARWYLEYRGDGRAPLDDLPISITPDTQAFYVHALLYRCHGFLTLNEIHFLLEGTSWEIPWKSLANSVIYNLTNEAVVCRKKQKDKKGNPYGYQLTQLGRDGMGAFCEESGKYRLKVADNIADKQHKTLREM